MPSTQRSKPRRRPAPAHHPRRFGAALAAFLLAAVLVGVAACSAPETVPAAGSSTPSSAATTASDNVPTGAAAQPAAAGATSSARSEELTPEILSSTATVQANIDTVWSLVQEFRRSYRGAEYRADDPRRETDENFRRMNAARRELIDLYTERDLDAADHLLLCRVTAETRDTADEAPAARAAVEHCGKFLARTDAPEGSTDRLVALSILGQSMFFLDDLDGAESAFRRYLATGCETMTARDATREEASRAALCKRLLTFFLPEILHRRGDAAGLVTLSDECKRRGVTGSRDLLRVQRYLLQDLWLLDDTTALSDMSSALLEVDIWGGQSDGRREIVPLALSAQSRLALLRDDFFGTRQVYMDYAWNYGKVSQPWREGHLDGPSRVLCRTAPALATTSWLDGRAPAVVPGAETLERPVLLHFFMPLVARAPGHLREVSALARKHRDELQVIGLVPVGLAGFSVFEQRALSGLAPAEYKKALEPVVDEFELDYPIAFLEAGESDADALRYGVRHFPVLILIDRRNRVVTYHTALEVDAGWSRCIEKVK